jgi:hypothetical protein
MLLLWHSERNILCLLAIAEEVTSMRISGFTSCNCHPVSVISETGMKVGLSMDCSWWALAAAPCHAVTLVDINFKYDGQQQEWLWSKIYSKKYWLGYLWLPQSQNMISLYLCRLRQSKATQDFLIWDLRLEHLFWMAKPISQLAELLYWNTTRSSW